MSTRSDRRRAGSQPIAFDELDRRTSLPLRLGVSRGGLGIELNQAVQIGPVSVEQMEWSLPTLDYPLDLSGGVKQFLHRRGLFERATLRIRPSELGRILSEKALLLWGEPVSCRVRVYASEAIVAVTLWSESVVLAFDLVLASAVELRWVVHRARGFGLERVPLEIVASFLTASAQSFEGTRDALVDGRSFTLGLWIEAIALELMPGLGCRLPEIGDPRLTRLSVDRGDLILSLEREGEPMPVSGLAVRLAGLADALTSADRALTAGDTDAARRLYMEALEDSPATPEVLFELGQLDALTGTRNESARLFLERARERLSLRSEGLARADEALYAGVEASLFRSIGRTDRALELWSQAGEAEDDATLAAFYSEAAADLEVEAMARLALLDKSIERAPQLTSPRWKRVSAILDRFPTASALQMDVALADVEQLHAMARGREEKATVFERAAALFSERGHEEQAILWLRQVLLEDPERESARVLLGQRLLERGEFARSVDLLRAALRSMEKRRAEEKEQPFSVFREQDRVRVLLARGLSEGFEEYAEAARLLAAVDGRSEFALTARELEWTMANRIDVRARRRTESRFLEAIELGYLPGSEDEKIRAHRLAIKMIEREQDEPAPEFIERLNVAVTMLSTPEK